MKLFGLKYSNLRIRISRMSRQKLFAYATVAVMCVTSLLYVGNILFFRPVEFDVNEKWIIKERVLNSKDHKQKVYTQEDILSLLHENSIFSSEEVSHFDLSSLSHLQATLTLHSLLDNVEYLCPRKLRMGHLGDGGWEVCDHGASAPKHGQCLVYSFGINYDFSFDDKVGSVYGCQVHSFDPSMTDKSHQRSKHVHFHDLGISNKSEVNKLGWKLDTLGGIRKKLGHLDTPIDVLKMDVENAEWAALPEMITSGQLKNVKQLLIEFHVTPSSDGWYRSNFPGPYLLDGEEARKRLGVVKSLLDAGFKAFYTHKNEHTDLDIQGYPGRTSACYEVHYINTNMIQ